MAKLYLIVHNVRSVYNVGSLLRTADGLGVERIYLSGYSPYPQSPRDERLPFEAVKIDRKIRKTALGAETSAAWEHVADIAKLVNGLRARHIKLLALEQTARAIDITKFKNQSSAALIVGSERGGLPDEVLAVCDEHLQIPMFGQKESFNVSVAAAMALYHLKFFA